MTLFLGDEDEGYKGLIFLCGYRIRDKKKSPLYAIYLLFKLLTESKQKDLFHEVFKDLDVI